MFDYTYGIQLSVNAGYRIAGSVLLNLWNVELTCYSSISESHVNEKYERHRRVKISRK